MKRILRKAVEVASPLLYKRFFSKAKSFSWNGKQAAVSITFDVEYDKDAKVLDKTVEIMDSYGIEGSFACIGKLVEQFPREHVMIADYGHEVVNHTYSHPNHDVINPSEFFNKIPVEQQEFEISEFEKVSEKILGVKPVGFRAPHFGDLNSQNAYEILEKRGYLYSSSTVLTKTKSHGMPFKPSKSNFLSEGEDSFDVVELPVMTCPKHFYSVFDSFHCFRTSPPAHPPKQFAELFKKSVLMAKERNIAATFYFDPVDVVGLKEFEECLDFLKKNDVWIAKSCDVVKCFNGVKNG